MQRFNRPMNIDLYRRTIDADSSDSLGQALLQWRQRNGARAHRYVFDLMVLQPEARDFSDLFPTDKPVFAFHGYPAMMHKLTHRRPNHDDFRVRGYREERTTTMPFVFVVLNNLDHYQPALDAIRWIARLSDQVANATARPWSAISPISARARTCLRCGTGVGLHERRSAAWMGE